MGKDRDASSEDHADSSSSPPDPPSHDALRSIELHGRLSRTNLSLFEVESIKSDRF